MADVLEEMGSPAVVTVEQVIDQTCKSSDLSKLGEWLEDRRNSRQIPFRMEQVGYVPVRNAADKVEGRWVVWVAILNEKGGWDIVKRRRRFFGKAELLPRDAVVAVQTEIEIMNNAALSKARTGRRGTGRI
jgi:hypothetical protein